MVQDNSSRKGRIMNKAAKDERLLLPLWPDVGRLLGIGRNSVYEAARRGEIPTITIGARRLVPVAALMKKLESA